MLCARRRRTAHEIRRISLDAGREEPRTVCNLPRLLVWDGGNNDTPFFSSDLEIVVADPLAVAKPEAVRGQRVLVVEDGPTVTHGEMPYGAGVIAARQFGAAEIVDAKPYAVGSIQALMKLTHIWAISFRRWVIARR